MRVGLVLNEEIEWVSFHGVYDFAYFLRLVTGEELPEKESEFDDRLKTYFPHYYDVKHLLKESEILTRSLTSTAAALAVYHISYIATRYHVWGSSTRQEATVY